MLSKLSQLENPEQLGRLLLTPSAWTTKYIDYTPPIVERMTCAVAIDGVEHRLHLHRIHACEKAHYHPHPWPSAIRVLGGKNSTYEMGLGDASTRNAPLAKFILKPGSAYEMMNPAGYHYVQVWGEPSISIMLTGPVWSPDQNLAPQTSFHFRELTEDEKSFILQSVWKYYRF